jgi:hypothetical protein
MAAQVDKESLALAKIIASAAHMARTRRITWLVVACRSVKTQNETKQRFQPFINFPHIFRNKIIDDRRPTMAPQHSWRPRVQPVSIDVYINDKKLSLQEGKKPARTQGSG